MDAFNGKVDTILSSVRHDNYGTLRQKVEDAFRLVNQNGHAQDLLDHPQVRARLELARLVLVEQPLELVRRALLGVPRSRCRTSSGMSSGRSRSGGIVTTMPRRDTRSGRSASGALLVAAMKRTSARRT